MIITDRWYEHAACGGVATNLFYDTFTVLEALEYCNGCPVVMECRAANDAEEPDAQVFGVRGGEQAEERLMRRGYKFVARAG